MWIDDVVHDVDDDVDDFDDDDIDIGDDDDIPWYSKTKARLRDFSACIHYSYCRINR